MVKWFELRPISTQVFNKYLISFLIIMIIIIGILYALKVNGFKSFSESTFISYQKQTSLLDSLSSAEKSLFSEYLRAAIVEGKADISQTKPAMISDLDKIDSLLAQISVKLNKEYARTLHKKIKSSFTSFRANIGTLDSPANDIKSKEILRIHYAELSKNYLSHQISLNYLKKEFLSECLKEHSSANASYMVFSLWFLLLAAFIILIFLFLVFFIGKLHAEMQQLSSILKSEVIKRKRDQAENLKTRENYENTDRQRTEFIEKFCGFLTKSLAEDSAQSRTVTGFTRTEKTGKIKETPHPSNQRLIHTINLVSKIYRKNTSFFLAKFVSQDIVSILNELAHNFRKAAEEMSLQFTYKTDYSEVIIETDKEIFTLVFESLIHSVFYQMREGSVILEVQSARTCRGSYEIIISVTAAGAQIDNFYEDGLWSGKTEVNNNAESQSSDLGVGLPVIKKFVKRLGGNVTMTRRENQSIVFNVRFDVKEENLTASDETVTHINPDQWQILEPRDYKKLSILYVEDDELIGNYVASLLSGISNIDLAPDSQTALSLIRSSIYDIILMDIHLGNDSADGLTLTKKLRNLEAYKNTPIICITAFTMQGDKEAFLEQGCSQYLAKPFSPDQLFREIDKAVRQMALVHSK
ncbi:MAG: hypothetical protein FMNOHCHN_00648 [Ignavibacteriaceae bacterium]|nr:hypothetical protein [Ignavibacteriaceae bacterium]